MPTENAKRNSRFTPATRSIRPELLTDLDLNVLLTLAYDRFLACDYIAKLVGSSYDYITNRATQLASPPHAYIKICDEQADPQSRVLYLYVKRQFELTKLGQQVVFDKFGIAIVPRHKVPSRGLKHQIDGDQAMASFRIGAKESDGRFQMLTRNELLQHPTMPEATRNSPTPDFIPLGDDIKSEGGKMVPHSIRPDREMFVIRDLSNKKAYFFPGFEIGTGSETHSPKSGRHDHSYTRSKFEDYITIIEKKIYRTHFGAPNLYIPFLETSPHRLENMMREHLLPMTETRPHVRRFFPFKRICTFTEKHMASGYMLCDPFLILDEFGQIAEFSLV
jgi:hypothetical protein